MEVDCLLTKVYQSQENRDVQILPVRELLRADVPTVHFVLRRALDLKSNEPASALAIVAKDLNLGINANVDVKQTAGPAQDLGDLIGEEEFTCMPSCGCFWILHFEAAR